MFKKLFSSATDDKVNPAQIERGLAVIATQVPSVRWAALVSSSGLVQGVFPSHPEPGEDRIAAMSAAMWSLGERISGELRDGGLRYTFLCGETGGALLLALDEKRALSLGLDQGAALPPVLEALRLELVPLLATLQIESLPWL